MFLKDTKNMFYNINTNKSQDFNALQSISIS